MKSLGPGLGPRHAIRSQRAQHAQLAALILMSLFAVPVTAANRVPFEAHAGLTVAAGAAQVWSEDAILVYVENDEDVDTQGDALRWGYLFYSPGLQKSRAYSVRDGKILVAENLEMTFEAPPLSVDWIDSGVALRAAEANAGREFCRDHEGRLGTMLLTRGAFSEGDPDQTTWTVIYTAPHAPSLFVVVDAAGGKVRRTWRG